MATQRHIIIAIFLSSLFFLVSTDSYAGLLEKLSEGQSAFNSGDYENAVKIWRDAALQGSSNAQVLVGLAYAKGWGVAKDLQSSRMWYHIAAENNNPTAQFLLGLYYISHSDIPQVDTGLMWIKRAAHNGDISAKGFLKKAEEKHWFENLAPRDLSIERKKIASNNN
jgi:TPR repeat protein